MKSIIIFLFFSYVSFLNALTVEEFIQLESSNQISVFSNRPDKQISRSEDLLKLYSAGLSAESIEVQRAAAQASGLLMSGIQSAKPSQIPDFPEEDTRQLQQNLLFALESDDKYTRIGAAAAIAYSSSPDAQIEKLLLSQIKNEVDSESKISILTAMAVAGYKSDDIAVSALSLLEGTKDIDIGHAGHRAAKLLGFLKNPVVLGQLAKIAQGTDSRLSVYALQAIASYVEGAASIKDIISGIINDTNREIEVTNYAKLVLDAINEGKSNPSGIYAMNTRKLWPLALSEQNEFRPEQNAATVKASEPLAKKSEIKKSIDLKAPQIPKEESESTSKASPEVITAEPAIEAPEKVLTTEPVEEGIAQSSNRWLWLAAAVLVVGGLSLAVRRRG